MIDIFVIHKNVFFCTEIIESGVGPKFARALARMVSPGHTTGDIVVHNLINTLTTMQHGTLEEKVQLLVKFMDVDETKSISKDEIKEYIPLEYKDFIVFYEKLFAKLGYDDENPLKTHNDFFQIFAANSRGEDAISLFCSAVINIILTRNGTEQTSTQLRLKKQKSNSSFRIATTIAEPGQTTLQDSMDSKEGTSWTIYLLHIYRTHCTKENIFLTSLVLMEIFLWLLNFFYYYRQSFPISFCIAKGFGLNLRILTILLYLTMARSTLSKLAEFTLLEHIIPLGFNISIHSFLGFSTLVASIGHVCGHIAFKQTQTDYSYSSYNRPSFIKGTARYDDGAYQGDTITGTILCFCILAMTITAMNRGKGSLGYAVFYRTHFLYVVWIVVVTLHVPALWPWFISIAGLMFLERSIDFFHSTIHATLINSRPCVNGVTFLSVPRVGPAPYAGCYYRIKIPALSKIEWHPFSLANKPDSHNLSFFVASLGDWTADLYKMVHDPVLRANTKVLVQGPFSAPARSCLEQDITNTQMCVASGVGITPFLNIIAAKVEEEMGFETDKKVYANMFTDDGLPGRHAAETTFGAIYNTVTKASNNVIQLEEVRPLHLVWSIRDVNELLFYIEYITQVVQSQTTLNRAVVYVHVYLTGLGKNANPKFLLSQTLFLLALSGNSNKYLEIYFGRPNMEHIVEYLGPSSIYYCGGAALKHSLNEICQKNTIHFHPEDFDSGAKTLDNFSKYVRSKLCK